MGCLLDEVDADDLLSVVVVLDELVDGGEVVDLLFCICGLDGDDEVEYLGVYFCSLPECECEW